MDFAMAGPAIVLGLGCLGSAIGCGIAGMASHGVMSRVDEDHGKFIALSAVPSSQAIYSFILLVLMRDAINANKVSQLSGVFIGLFVGLAILVSAYYQGKCAATAIQASAKQPSIYGRSLAAIVVIESFSLFALVFSLLLL